MRALGILVAVLILAVLALAGASALNNRGLPTRSAVTERLPAAEQARLAEALHLRAALGDSIWPGWGSARNPVVVYNEAFAFILGEADPAPGWVKIPGEQIVGGPWEIVPGDTFAGAPYHRQRLPGPGVTPEAFTVRVGGRYASSLPTLERMQIVMTEQFRRDLPSVLRPIFPYRLATNLFLGGTDGYISMLLHEAFHAHQAATAPARLEAAERATRLERVYEAPDATLRGLWKDELRWLAEAAAAESCQEAEPLARRFLAVRHERRRSTGLSPDLVDYERQREWLEGLAKYVELQAWRAAATTPTYRPLAALAADPAFQGYSTFFAQWSRELAQIRRADGDVRFYYSGMAQASMLDRLAPGWKTRGLSDAAWLDSLLGEALPPGGPSPCR
ncbi:MAG: hypothetical protein NDJ94_06570 [Vicinamibacteria bacterium]|nr:hypothetical protein [Vicinamibacteria bacterium]